MILASLSLSLPRSGWKSTSTPRSLKICTAADDRASEMRTRGVGIGHLYLPPPCGEGLGVGVVPLGERGECDENGSTNAAGLRARSRSGFATPTRPSPQGGGRRLS